MTLTHKKTSKVKKGRTTTFKYKKQTKKQKKSRSKSRSRSSSHSSNKTSTPPVAPKKYNTTIDVMILNNAEDASPKHWGYLADDNRRESSAKLRAMGGVWPTPNIAYRRSTGTSNEFCNGIISSNDIWVPTFGIVTNESLEEWRKRIQLDPPIEPGYITKVDALYPTTFIHQTNFIVNTLTGYEKQSKMIKGFTDKYLAFSHLQNLEKTHGKLICLFRDVFPHYFANWKQLQWSAIIGGVFWEQPGVPEIREFILNYTINPKSTHVWKLEKLATPTNDIDIIEPRITIDESDINSYMEKHSAFAKI